MRSFCRKTHVHKIPHFRGGFWGKGGGGECRFYFYGREDFSDFFLLSEPSKALEDWCRAKMVEKCRKLLLTLAVDRKGTPKNFYDKDFAELSGELSGAICLKTLVLLGNDLFRKFFGTVRAIFLCS